MKKGCKLKTGKLLQSIFLLIILSISIFHATCINGMFTMKPLQSKKYPNKSIILPSTESKKKGLLIFLDEDEKDKFGVASNSLLIALYQEVCPIIVSTSLLYNIFEYRSKDNRATDIFYEMPEMHDAEISKMAFQKDRWVIKQINDSLNLLLPVNYLNLLNVTSDAVKEYKYSTDDSISDTELRLGFKVNHMKSIDHESIHRSFLDYVKKTLLPVEYINYFVNSLDTIFCKKAEYKNVVIPEWYIYILGHGLVNHSIVSLSFNDFKQLLQFFDNKILTKLLVVSSCYAAGVNSKIIYGDMKSEMQQYFSFPIIFEGLNDMPIAGKYRIDFNKFFEKAKTLEGNYSDIIQPILSAESIAQIKLPGLEWFSVIEADKKIVSINSILAKTRDPEKPLDIVKFFKKDPDIILLYSDDIPFELKINSHNIKNIFSMISSALKKKEAIYTVEKKSWSVLAAAIGWLKRKVVTVLPKMSTILKSKDPVQVVHRMKKISSTTHDFFKMCSWFVNYQSIPSSKWFFIEEMIDKNNTYNQNILIIASEGKYTTIFPQSRHITVFFKDKENVLFKLSSSLDNKNKVMRGSDEERYYNERVRIIRNEYPQLSENSKEKKKEISREQIKKIESTLKKVPEKVLQSRKQVEEARRAREQTLIE